MWGWLGLSIAAFGFYLLVANDPSLLPLIGPSIAAQWGLAGLLLGLAGVAALLGLFSPSHKMPQQLSIWGALGLSVVVVFTRIDDFSGMIFRTVDSEPSIELEAQTDSQPALTEDSPEQEASAENEPEEPVANASTELKADDRGHFLTEAEIDGTTIQVMVDTGASAVALSYEDADNAGLRPHSLDYDVPVGTANGVVNAARVKLRRVEVDGVLVRDVDGLVLPEGVMNGTLLGMSFLSRLRSFKVEDNTLYLED